MSSDQILTVQLNFNLWSDSDYQSRSQQFSQNQLYFSLNQNNDQDQDSGNYRDHSRDCDQNKDQDRNRNCDCDHENWSQSQNHDWRFRLYCYICLKNDHILADCLIFLELWRYCQEFQQNQNQNQTNSQFSFADMILSVINYFYHSHILIAGNTHFFLFNDNWMYDSEIIWTMIKT